MKVENYFGIEIDFDVAVQLMDDDIREQVHAELAPCAEQAFFDAYCVSHEAAFGEPFVLAQPNPVY